MAIRYDAPTVHDVLQYGTLREVFSMLLGEIDLDCLSGKGDTVPHSLLKNTKLMEIDVTSILDTFLQQGFNPNTKNKCGQTVLHLSIKRRMKSTVDLLLTSKADFNVVDKNGNPIAHFFIEDEYKKCQLLNYVVLENVKENRKQIENQGVNFLHFLISRKIEFDCKNSQKDTVLDLAIDCQLLHILPTLLDYSRAIFNDNEKACKIVSNAIKRKLEKNIIQIMISYYLKYCEDRNLATTLFHKLIDTCQMGDSSEADYYLKVLSELRYLGVNISNELSYTPLKLTEAEGDNLALVDFLANNHINFNVDLRHQADVNFNARRRHETPLLHEIAERTPNKSDDIFRKLICELYFSHQEEVDECGKSALQIAVRFTNIEVVKILIEIGAKVNHRDDCKMTPLHEALLNVSQETDDALRITDLLVANGADLNAKDFEGDTPLHLAVYNNYIVELLLACGAPVNIKSENQQTPLHRAVTIKKADKAVELLLASGAEVDAKDIRGETPFHLAVSSNNLSAALILLLHNASVDCTNVYQQTPLHRAVMNDNGEEVVKMLLANAVDVNAKDDKGETPLHLAVCNDNLSIVRLLIEKNANINCKNNRQQTPLHRAVVMNETVDVIELLLKSGVHVNAIDSEGNRPIHLVCKRWKMDNCRRIMELLLKNGAYADARNNAGESALCIALSFRNTVVIRELLKYGIDVNDSKVREFLCKDHDQIPPVLFQHLLKLRAANLPLDEQYKAYIYHNCASDYQSFYIDCSEEIEILKRSFLYEHESVYDFLRVHLERRVRRYIRPSSCRLHRLVNSQDLNQQFPIYSSIILTSYHEAFTRDALQRIAERALFELIVPPGLPFSVTFRILDYLDNANWFNIIQAV